MRGSETTLRPWYAAAVNMITSLDSHGPTANVFLIVPTSSLFPLGLISPLALVSLIFATLSSECPCKQSPSCSLNSRS